MRKRTAEVQRRQRRVFLERLRQRRRPPLPDVIICGNRNDALPPALLRRQSTNPCGFHCIHTCEVRHAQKMNAMRREPQRTKQVQLRDGCVFLQGLRQPLRPHVTDLVP